MKKITFLLMITASLFVFNSCEDENDVTINYTSFESTSMDFGVELDGSSTNDITIYSTKTSGSARTFNINVLSASTADPSSYDVPATVTIPANSNVGTFPVTISDINIGEAGKTLILDLPEENGVYTGAPITLNVKQVCPFNEVILTITFDSYPEENIESEISFIALKSTAGSTGTVFKLELPMTGIEDLSKYRIGMNADVEIELAKKTDVLVIPLEAISNQQGQTIVKIKSQNSQGYEDRIIELGLESDEEAEVVSGLEEGEIILIED